MFYIIYIYLHETVVFYSNFLGSLFNLINQNIGLSKKRELTIMPELFRSLPGIKRWKIDFNLFTTSFLGGTGFARSSIIVAINQIPMGGTCSASPFNGISESTFFTIECKNFTDSDGYITKYEFYCKNPFTMA